MHVPSPLCTREKGGVALCGVTMLAEGDPCTFTSLYLILLALVMCGRLPPLQLEPTITYKLQFSLNCVKFDFGAQFLVETGQQSDKLFFFSF